MGPRLGLRCPGRACPKGEHGIGSLYPHCTGLCTFSHCADAVLSFANKTTVVGDIANTLSEFATAWTTTLSEYDTLFATTVRHDWARRHRPVLSRGNGLHYLYTGFHVTEPHGKLVRCHQMCGVEARSFTIKDKVVVIRCKRCRSTCTIDRVKPDRSTLGTQSIVKVAYPPDQVRVLWKFDDPRRQTTTSEGRGTSATVVPKSAGAGQMQGGASMLRSASSPDMSEHPIPTPVHMPAPVSVQAHRIAPSPPSTVLDLRSLGTHLPGPSTRSHSMPQMSDRRQKRDSAPAPLVLSTSPPPNPAKRRKRW